MPDSCINDGLSGLPCSNLYQEKGNKTIETLVDESFTFCWHLQTTKRSLTKQRNRCIPRNQGESVGANRAQRFGSGAARAPGNLILQCDGNITINRATPPIPKFPRTLFKILDWPNNRDTRIESFSFAALTALPQLLKQTAAATPMYPRATAYDGH